MADHYQPRSKGTWGREEAKTAEELNRLCNEFFNALVVPAEWKFLGWHNVVDETLAIISVGKIFRDMRTSGMNMMEYRIYFHTFSTKGGLVSKTIVDFGKDKKLCEVSNKTIEKLNEWINEKYTQLPKSPEGGIENQIYDKDDGLQHFRDRFGN